jgi:uncharacterized protein YdeI (YjbR/CyaY-like superfamily)
MAKTTRQLYLTSRGDWRAWLEENHAAAKEVWLVYYKKHTGKPTIPYDDAVEEALCFGWIDGLVRSIDDERYTQRYTPRRGKSIWSESNRRRVEKMVQAGRMTEAGLAKVEEAMASGEWDKAISWNSLASTLPTDLQEALAANRTAQKHFTNMAPSYQKQYVWWITSAKRKDTREKRIRETVRRAEQNRKPGTG